MTRAYTKRPVAERFWGKVDKTGDCWAWGAVMANGYGRFYPTRERLVLAHRWVWEQEYGPIPEGTQVDHMCHNESDCPGGDTCEHRRCVRPNHLRLATPRANTLAGKSSAAFEAKQTHCLNGHPFVEGNIYWQGRKRHCRRCRASRYQQFVVARGGERTYREGLAL